MNHCLFITLLSVSLGTPAMAATRHLQPGLWEVGSDTSVPGIPIQVPSQTVRNCYTAADLAQAQDAVRQGGYANCKVQDFLEKGDTATWAITCSGEPKMRGTGTMTSTATTFSGSMDSVVNYPGGAMAMTNRWHAKRVGDCK